MMNGSPGIKVEFDERFWPVEQAGPLHPLIDAELLYRAFFRSGPAVWNVSSAVVRRALKSFLKRVGRAAKISETSDTIEERDRLLIWRLCNDARCRDRVTMVHGGR